MAIIIGQHVAVPQLGKESRGTVVAISGAVVIVKILDGPNAGYCLDFPAQDVRVPAAFEVA